MVEVNLPVHTSDFDLKGFSEWLTFEGAVVGKVKKRDIKLAQCQKTLETTETTLNAEDDVCEALQDAIDVFHVDV